MKGCMRDAWGIRMTDDSLVVDLPAEGAVGTGSTASFGRHLWWGKD
jgi:hypothetical protein